MQIQVKKHRGNWGCQKAPSGEAAHGPHKIRIYPPFKLQCRLLSAWKGLCWKTSKRLLFFSTFAFAHLILSCFFSHVYITHMTIFLQTCRASGAIQRQKLTGWRWWIQTKRSYWDRCSTTKAGCNWWIYAGPLPKTRAPSRNAEITTSLACSFIFSSLFFCSLIMSFGLCICFIQVADPCSWLRKERRGLQLYKLWVHFGLPKHPTLMLNAITHCRACVQSPSFVISNIFISRNLRNNSGSL